MTSSTPNATTAEIIIIQESKYLHKRPNNNNNKIIKIIEKLSKIRPCEA